MPRLLFNTCALLTTCDPVTPREVLERLFQVAVQAADPRAATRRAVASMTFPRAPAVIAVGKAAASMASGAIDALLDQGADPHLGLVVSHTGEPRQVGRLPHLAGAHPLPDASSFAASHALEQLVPRAREAGDVLVLLSGGTTSLLADTTGAMSREDLVMVFEALLRSGAPINAVNAIRRRVLRWGGGRLARALAPARVHCFIVSDVMGGELAAIGSGPCVADPTTAADVRAVIDAWHVEGLPASLFRYLDRVQRGEESETPKPGDLAVESVHAAVLLDNAAAVAAVWDAGGRMGLARAPLPDLTLAGGAARAGSGIGRALATIADSLGTDPPLLFVAGGEPTVALPPGPPGCGGRCQELALAAALALQAAGTATHVTLLAAGTDGRDGPTDAAGAIVDRATGERIARAGRDAWRDLAAHDAYPALDSVDALLRTGPTGTNVNDLVIALIG